MTQQKHLFHSEPERTTIESTIIAVRPHFYGVAIATAENIVRAAGGGEPRDVGEVAGMPIRHVEKQGGMTWIALEGNPGDYRIGQAVGIDLDAGHRNIRRRLHTGTHLAIRCAYNHFGDIHIIEAEIAEDASSARIVGKVDRPIGQADIWTIDQAMRSEVLKARPVTTTKAKSVEHAEREYGPLFRVSDRHAFQGKVRLVCIQGLDVNPCSGLHHLNSNIGAYEMKADLTHVTVGVFDVRLNLASTWMYWFGE